MQAILEALLGGPPPPPDHHAALEPGVCVLEASRLPNTEGPGGPHAEPLVYHGSGGPITFEELSLSEVPVGINFTTQE